jgi:ceramide glucosyltransferase
MTVAECATGFSLLMTGIQVVSTTVARFRCPERQTPLPAAPDTPPVSLIRPVCGVDNYAEETLRSSFTLDYPHYELLFCCARADDPVLGLLRKLVAAHPDIPSRILVGDDEISANPKLNNCVKGWAAAAHTWIIMADSNVLMPRDYIQRLLAAWKPDTGLVCSTPIGSRPEGFWAEVECGFLNTLQARWQYTAESIGFGFAQGKSMLWRRDILDQRGGIHALGAEIAEDAAATKLIRSAGLKVRLVDSPFEQPLGKRTIREIWARQVRWARLRRVTFLPFFLLEIVTGCLFPALAGAYAASAADYDPVLAAAIITVIFMACEIQLALAAGWRCTVMSPFAWLARDLMLPILFTSALLTDEFVWRGNEMSVKEEEAKTG